MQDFQDIEKMIQHEARDHARAWPGLTLEDCNQEAWRIALECLPNFDESKGSRKSYVKGAIRRGLLNWGYQTTQPVHTPKNREYAYADRARRIRGEAADTAIATREAPRAFCPEARLETRSKLERLSRALDALADVDATLAEAFGDNLSWILRGGPRELAEADPDRRGYDHWRYRCRRAREVIRTELGGAACTGAF